MTCWGQSCEWWAECGAPPLPPGCWHPLPPHHALAAAAPRSRISAVSLLQGDRVTEGGATGCVLREPRLAFCRFALLPSFWVLAACASRKSSARGSEFAVRAGPIAGCAEEQAASEAVLLQRMCKRALKDLLCHVFWHVIPQVEQKARLVVASSERGGGAHGSTFFYDPLSHRIIEKRRRDRMNNCLADLSRLIPTYYLKKGRGRIEKTEIIEMAIKYMKHLQAHACNQMENCEVTTKQEWSGNQMEQFHLGYQECMSETMQFLVESEGFFSGDSLCVRLMNHLTKHCEKILNSEGYVMRQNGASSSSSSGYHANSSSTGSSSDGNGNSSSHASESKDTLVTGLIVGPPKGRSIAAAGPERPTQGNFFSNGAE
ncbi:Hairy/enhancer-of-split related with YRPW motif protein 2 [Penaeus vannamei]|uniref:Hairy/enhancer-of-split related with YRPW motif protein 2 n=1 Tax=Penaeus vannamei TaxID=6689 RepID=A0A3R7SRA4_PENVA|nr:Hairy/enhancer-of-split related with YRPW motif protein 2 [Penaeus vannamei]